VYLTRSIVGLLGWALDQSTDHPAARPPPGARRTGSTDAHGRIRARSCGVPGSAWIRRGRACGACTGPFGFVLQNGVNALAGTSGAKTGTPGISRASHPPRCSRRRRPSER